MIKCKVCGTANSPDSSVCSECGSALRASRRNNSTDSNKEIFSNTKTEGLQKSGEQRDLFSSGEKYEKMRKGAVLEKIYKQEQAMGEVTKLEEPPEPEEVKPIVINRQSSSDIVGKKRYSSKNGKNGSESSKTYKIPQRIIEPVDSQLLGHKIKPQVTDTPEDENEKVELKASDPIGDIKKKNKKSSKPQNRDGQQKKYHYSNSRNDGKQNRQNKNSNSENRNVKKDNRSEGIQNSQRKKASVKESAGENAQITTVKARKSEPKDNSSVSSTAAEKTMKKESGKKVNAANASKVTAKTDIQNRKPKSEQTSKSSGKSAVVKTEVKNTKPKKTYENAANANETMARKAKPEKAAGNSDKKTSGEVKPRKTKPESTSDISEKEKSKNETNTLPKKKNEKTAKDTTVRKSAKAKSSSDTVKSRNPEKSKSAKNSDNKSAPKSRVINNDNFTVSDINSSKNIAALSYIGILVLIPLVKSRSSVFCKVHSKQGLAVFVYSLIISLITLAAVIGLRILLLWHLCLSYMIYNIAAASIGILMLILLLVPVFSGAVAAFNGEYRSVPIVGKFVNKKNHK